MDIVSAKKFLTDFAQGEVEEQEEEAFRFWLMEAQHAEIEAIALEYEQLLATTSRQQQADRKLVSKVEAALDDHTKKVKYLSGRKVFAVAASVLILLLSGIVAYYLITASGFGDSPIEPGLAKDIIPAQKGAILTLADGSQIRLDSLKNGLIARERGADLQLLDGGLNYIPVTSNENRTSSVSYNSIMVPKGHQYAFTLPDGSKMWLNAASSVKYPTAFTGDDREIEVTGEVYLEVAAGSHKPFRVITQRQVVEVLGTRFNINAYEDEEAVRTTLLEGSVRVRQRQADSGVPSLTPTGRNIILQPGQQAVSYRDDVTTIYRQQVNTEDIIAWKNNFFVFDGIDIRGIMRQLARWYDIDVAFASTPSSELYRGKVPGNTRLSELLKVLELNDIKFSFDKRKMTVYP